MLFADISILDENFDYRPHQWVGVTEGKISYVGDVPPQDAPRGAASKESRTMRPEPRSACSAKPTTGTGKLLMPALYNAHTHAPMTLLRGYAENLPLQAWLNDMVWPFEAKMTVRTTTGARFWPAPRWRAMARWASPTCTTAPTSAWPP